MQFTAAALALLSAASLSFGAPTPSADPAAAAAKEYQWKVTKWEAGCARRGCFYTFDVAGPKQGDYPNFTASCTADESVGHFFTQCKDVKGSQNVAVTSRFLERTGDKSTGPKKFAVSIQYNGAEPGSYFNATGYHATIYNQFVAPQQSFTVKPTEMWGVA